jgi:hypothetical protein
VTGVANVYIATHSAQEKGTSHDFDSAMVGSTRWRQHSEQLADCAIRFSNRIPVIARTSEIRVRKCDPPVRTTAQHIP